MTVAPPTERERLSSGFTFLVLGMALLSCVSYLLWPLGADPSVHFTGIHQALTSGRGLSELWNFRGPSYNLYLLALYRIATSFVDFFDRRAFDLAVRALHLVVLTGGCLVWARGLAEAWRLVGRERVVAAALALFALTACWNTTCLHAEDVATVTLAFAWGLSSQRDLGSRLAAGLLIGLLPLMKGTTAVYALPLFVNAYFAGGRKQVATLVGLSSATFLAQVLVLQVAAPMQLADLLETIAYQGDHLSLADRLRNLARLPAHLVYQPVLVPALAATLLQVVLDVKRRDRRELLLLASLWGACLLPAAIQGTFLTYHLAPLGLVSAYALVRLVTPERAAAAEVVSAAAPIDSRRWLGLRLAFLALMGLVWLLYFPLSAKPPLTLPFLVGTVVLLLTGVTILPANRTSLSAGRFTLLVVAALVIWFAGDHGFASPHRLQKTWRRLEHARETMLSKVEARVGSGNRILLAAYGVAARDLDVISDCRHFFPLPLQREQPGSGKRMQALAGYRENRDCFKRYRGQYVLLERNWFRRDAIQRSSVFRRYQTVDRFSLGGRNYQLLRKKK